MPRNSRRDAWVPMTRGPVNPQLLTALAERGSPTDHIEAWGNGLYDAVVRRGEGGFTHISFKRMDRAAVRDWRHFQQIKNDICGEESEAVELFPAESRLVDTANEYHLWVFPAGASIPLGFPSGLLATPEEIEEFNKGQRAKGHQGKARQRAWQPGLTTGQGGKAQ